MIYLLQAIKNKRTSSLIMLIAVVFFMIVTIFNWNNTSTIFCFDTWAFFLGLATTTFVALSTILRNEIIRIRDEENLP